MAINRTITSITGTPPPPPENNTVTPINIIGNGGLTFPDTGLSVRDGEKFQVIDLALEGANEALEEGSIVDIEWKEGGSKNKAIRGQVTKNESGIIEITGLALTGKFKFQFFGLLEIDDPKLAAARSAAELTDEMNTAALIAEQLVKKKGKSVITAELTRLNGGTALTAEQAVNGNDIVLRLADRMLSPAAVTISVSIGNMNTEDDWIIDFSAEQATGKKSSINVGALIDWIQRKNNATGDGGQINNDPELPAGDGMQLQVDDPDSPGNQKNVSMTELKNYEVVFEDFWFNITKKIFKIDIRSGKDENGNDQELNIGAFTIKKIGFTLTNQPPPGKYASLERNATAALKAAAAKEAGEE